MECRDHTKPRKVKIIVEKVPANEKSGKMCHIHTQGQEFIFDFQCCPQNFCASAFHSLWPALRVLEMGGRHPWDESPNQTRSCCPDQDNPVTFRMEVCDE